MQGGADRSESLGAGIVLAAGEAPVFGPGDRVRILTRSPVGHYRVPIYLRGKTGTVEAVIEPAGVDNEEEAYGRNAGAKRHYYRIAVPMTRDLAGLCRLAARRAAHRGVRDLAGEDLTDAPEAPWPRSRPRSRPSACRDQPDRAARLLRDHGDGGPRAADREAADRRRTRSAGRSRSSIRERRRSGPRSLRGPGSIPSSARGCWRTAARPARSSGSASTTTPG